MSSHQQILWISHRSEPVAARVAIAGDFIPAGGLVVPPFGWRQAAHPLAGHLNDIHTCFLNLEGALDVSGLSARPLAGLGEIVAAPPACLHYLAALHCHAVGLANNHAYDFGPTGVERTQQALHRRSIVSLGAGVLLRNAPDVFIWQGPGRVRVGFWAAARASHDLATSSRVGVEPATIKRARQAIQSLRSAGAKFSVALLHAGCLRTNRPDPSDAKLMDRIADWGFGLVAAAHSHRISGARLVRTRLGIPSFCFYGLGTIVSGYVSEPLEREGLILVASFHSDGSLARVSVRPVFVAENGFGEVPSFETSRTILDRFQSLSSEIAGGSAQRLFYEDLFHGLARLYFRDARAAFRESGIRGLIRKASRVRLRHVRRLVHGLVG